MSLSYSPAEIRELAARVGDRLMAELRSGQRDKIDIAAIREALQREVDFRPGTFEFDMLEDLTTRHVVGSV